jgi:hypothetical protein
VSSSETGLLLLRGPRPPLEVGAFSVAGLPDGLFSNQKNHNLGKFWKALKWEMLVYFWSFGSFYGHLVYLMAIW